MSEEEHRPGVIPRSRRRLAIWMLIAVGVATLAGSLVVNVVAGSPVEWFWVVVGTIFVTGLMAMYLWVRLSD